MDLSERPEIDDGQRHPWEQARAWFLLDLLDDVGVLCGAPRVLDVGAGDAWLAQQLMARAPAAQVTCWDTHYRDDDLAAISRARLRATRELPAEPFDLALLLDVLEHVDDDVALLRAVVERLPAGGRALVSVPAWPALFSSHDVALQHRRRYTPSSCCAVMREAGLLIEGSGGFFSSLLLPRALQVLRERVSGQTPRAHGVGRWRHQAAVTNAIVGALRAEQALSRAAHRVGLSLPGLSFWAIGVKR